MKFYIEAVQGDLILIKTNISTAPPCPIMAQSTIIRPAPWLIRLVAFFIALIPPLVDFIAHWPPPIWTANKARVTVLAIVTIALASALVEAMAQSHIEKTLGALC